MITHQFRKLLLLLAFVSSGHSAFGLIEAVGQPNKIFVLNRTNIALYVAVSCGSTGPWQNLTLLPETPLALAVDQCGGPSLVLVIQTEGFAQKVYQLGGQESYSILKFDGEYTVFVDDSILQSPAPRPPAMNNGLRPRPPAVPGR